MSQQCINVKLKLTIKWQALTADDNNMTASVTLSASTAITAIV